MSLSTEDMRCEKCDSPATYRPQLNRTLCLLHLKELEAERAVYLYAVRNIETVATEMLNQYQIALSKQKIIDVMKTAVNKSLNELELD